MKENTNSYFYLSIDFDGYGVRIRAPNLESTKQYSKGYQQLVRCFADLDQLNNPKISEIFEKYQIEVFFE